MRLNDRDLELGMAGDDVAVLHRELRAADHDVPEDEVADGRFGEGTARAVLRFQDRVGLAPTGVVDDATALAVNRAVGHDLLLVRGTVTTAGGAPVDRYTVRAVDRSQGGEPLLLGEARPGRDGRYRVYYERARVLGAGRDRAEVVVDVEGEDGRQVASVGSVTHDEPVLTVDVVVEDDGRRAGSGGRVTGRLFRTSGVAAAGTRLRAYHRGFGGQAQLLGEAVSGDDGAYAVEYQRDGLAPNLEVRLVREDGSEVALSAPKYEAAAEETLNLVAPADPAAAVPEADSLFEDVAQVLGDARLADARESGDRRDLTLLRATTGWDARLLALAATADGLADRTGLDASVLYGAFRAGLPTDLHQLAAIPPETLRLALGAATEAGIVGLDEAAVDAAAERFAAVRRDVLLEQRLEGTPSSAGEFLEAADVSPETRERFAEVFVSREAGGAGLWRRAAEAGIDEAEVRTLQVQGRLAHLTGNNARLARDLQAGLDGDDLGALVDLQLDAEAAWSERLRALANDDDDLAALVPAAYAGDTLDARLAAYSEDLARKVRLAFPGRVVARMVESDELALVADGDGQRQGVSTFLRAAEPAGFALGRTPVEAFVRDHPDLVDAVADVREVTEEVKRLQRLYQVTPGNEAMKVLAGLGFTSAFEIAAVDRQKFIDWYAPWFPSEQQAELVYRKAQQVAAVSYNAFAIAKQADTAPAVHAVSAPPAARQAAREALVKHYPTMESLFGELDYCECEHCRSVLSPAAYLVDLLQFLDPTELVWKGFVDDWAAKHDGAPYPFRNRAEHDAFLARWRPAHPGQPDPVTTVRPYDVLVERRPDLPHLPLTCENTNTVLPYIDLVNEILEYHVAHGALDAGAANDTGSAASTDLVAEPQHVEPAAYEELRTARYPVGLPFDLWTETVRAYCDHFEVPLWTVLETLRTTDDLFVAPGAAAYDRTDVFAEQLRLTGAERSVLTDADPLAGWSELYGLPDEATALAELRSAKALSRRLGVGYATLVDVVRTEFVNPEREALAFLGALGVSAGQAVAYKQHEDLLERDPATLSVDEARLAAELAAFRQRLVDLTDRFAATVAGFDATAWLDAAWQAGTFDDVVVLADPDAGCSLEHTTLQTAAGQPVDAFTLHRINVFVRLWRRLGWTTEETDRALTTFLPADLRPLTPATLGPAMTTALLSIAHLDAFASRFGVGRGSRLRLLTAWRDLDTGGSAARYAQLFLTPSVLATDPVFDHPLGRHLQRFDQATATWVPFTWDPGQPEDPKAGNVALASHLGAVQGALGVTADEVRRVLDDAGTSLDEAPLNVAVLSLLDRHAVLADALGLSVAELRTIVALSGVDPFAPLAPGAVTDVAGDRPWSATLRFVDLADAIATGPLTVDELAFLVRHEFDPGGPLRPDPATSLALTRALAAGTARIAADHRPLADPDALTDELLARELALVLPADVADTVVRMWQGTVVYEPVQDATAAEALDPADLADVANRLSVRYDEVRGRQHLLVRGVLLDAERQAIEAAHPSPLLASLLAEAQAQGKAFFDRHLVRGEAVPPVGFLAPDDLGALFGPPPAGADDAALQAWQRDRRAGMAAALLPYVQRRLVRALVTEALAASLDAPATTVEALVTDPALLEDPAAPGRSLLDGFTAAGVEGITATFWPTPDRSGAPHGTATVRDADVSAAPPGTASVRFDCYVDVAAAGAYRFVVQAAASGATAELRLSSVQDPALRLAGGAAGSTRSAVVDLRPGEPVRLTLDAGATAGGDVVLLVQGEGLPVGSLGRLACTPAAVVERVGGARTLLAKVVRVAQAFAIGDRALRHLLTRRAELGGVDLGRLPSAAPVDPATAVAVFGDLRRMAAFARLRDDLGAADDDLVELFEAARRTFPAGEDPDAARTAVRDDLCRRFAVLTRRDDTTVKEVLDHLGWEADAAAADDQLSVTLPGLTGAEGARRVWDVLALVERFGVPFAALVRWTAVVDADADEAAAVAAGVREAVRARYPADAWRRVAKAVNDPLRRVKRDALVAAVLHDLGLSTVEQLFEHFLLDPGMEPVVETSRLRLAISSVQTFVQRCLLNLEPKVHPRAVDAAQWEWVKRYRVWEANRKIFLFPENWLEPEWRDDKTPQFRRLESALLQGDVTDDLVEAAFFGYLSELETLARLEIVNTYMEQDPLDPAGNVLHVIGRTYGRPHAFHHRRYAHGAWSPWEPVTGDVEGDHVVVAKWRDRLHVFWVLFLDRADPSVGGASTPADGGTLQTVTLGSLRSGVRQPMSWKTVDLQLNWVERGPDGWSGRTSTPFSGNVSVPSWFNPLTVPVHVTHEYEDGVESLDIHLGDIIGRRFHLVSRNAVPTVLTTGGLPAVPYPITGINATKRVGSGPLTIVFTQKIETEDGQAPVATTAHRLVLTKGGVYSLVRCANPLTLATPEVATLVTPFFYQDDRSTFYVEPTLDEVTFERWEDWVVPPADPDPGHQEHGHWVHVPLEHLVPVRIWPPPGPEPGEPFEELIDPLAQFGFETPIDWVANPRTAVAFGDDLVGPAGGVDVVALPDRVATAVPSAVLHAPIGSDMAAVDVVLAVAGTGAGVGGLDLSAGVVNVVGSAGLTAELLAGLRLPTAFGIGGFQR